MKRVIVVIAAVLAAACGGNSSVIAPSSTTTAPATFTLSGSVVSTTGTAISGATVRIVDGPNAGRSVLSDGNGSWTLTGLTQSGFTVTVSAPNYSTVSRGVTLTGSQALSVQLPPTPIAPATLVTTGQLSLPGCDGLIQLAAEVGLATANCKQFTGLLQNTSAGCAANVRGTTVIFTDAAGNSQISAGGWTYSGMVRPGEQIAYSGGPLSIPTKQWYWRTTPSWDSVRCQ